MGRRIPRMLCAAALLCGLALSPFTYAWADHHEDTGDHQPISIPAAEEAISHLPAPLQPIFAATLEVDKQTRNAFSSGDPAMMMAAGQAMGQAIKVCMEQTLQFLGSASPEDADKVAGVLHFFASEGQPDGPAPPGSEAVQMAQHMLHDAEMMIAGQDPGMGDPNMPL